MAKMSQTVKDITQIVVFLLVVGILLLVFVIYPLNRTKNILARPDADNLNPDSLPPNDVSALVDLPAVIDTFRVDADGLTSLACVYLSPVSDSGKPEVPQGLVVLLHDERQDRNAMLPLARVLLDSGLAVCLYDQRASGRSSGVYHGDGEYEAADLSEVIAFLRIRDRVKSPFVMVGQRAGADAALLSARSDPPPDGVVAIRPFLTTERWLDILMDEHDMYWIPFPHTIFMFWYELRSGYAPEGRSLETIRPPRCRTLILDTEDRLADETVSAYKQLSNGLITTAPLPGDSDRLIDTVIAFIRAASTVR